MKKTGSIQIIAEFPSHRLIQMISKCPHCNGTLFRHYPDGTIICVKCLTTVFDSEAKEQNN